MQQQQHSLPIAAPVANSTPAPATVTPASVALAAAAKNSTMSSVFGKGSKQKPLRVLVLGLAGVGKTALTVRFVTRRFIGEYDPTLEKVYAYQTMIGKEMVAFEILDSAGQSHTSQEAEVQQLEANMRWAEAFVLMYSVTDKCSFDECNRLKFLINYNKRRRRVAMLSGDDAPPVVMVANKKDQLGDRMITKLEGKKRAHDIGCAAFHEISVRESPDEAQLVFADLYHEWRTNLRTPKLKRSTSDLHHGPVTLDSFKFISSMAGRYTGSTSGSYGSNNNNNNNNGTVGCPSGGAGASGLGTPWTDRLLVESRQNSLDMPSGSGGHGGGGGNPRFRDRASTDGNLHSTNKIPYEKVKRSLYDSPLFDRRMSISMRGSNAVC